LVSASGNKPLVREEETGVVPGDGNRARPPGYARFVVINPPPVTRVNLRTLLPYLRPHAATLAAVAVVSLAAAAGTLLQPLLARAVLDRVGASLPGRARGGGAGRPAAGRGGAQRPQRLPAAAHG
jgi:hypothetical protein